ncbi:MAG: aminopeptidase P family protein [Candidatus Eremiobacteraeota bacterium]|nr:aminopeptidase P family protein [Candidatus Eremiobacteraeota bacterium]
MSSERIAERPGSAQKATHDTDAPDALVAFMAGGWIDVAADARPHPQLARLRERRAALSQAYRGAYVVVPAGRERVRANDTYFRFRPSSDFVYLMGDGEPEAVLVMEPAGATHRSVLFVRAHNRGQREFFTDRTCGELWVGRHRGVEESALYYGVDACHPLAELTPYMKSLHDGTAARVLVRAADERVDGLFEQSERDGELASRLAEMRLIKDAYELDEIRAACALTKLGFEDAIRAMRNARSEREIEAAFWGRSRIEGNDVGYLTIAAAGEHACTLHWTRNDGALPPDGLLLLDAGTERASLYTADVTRTLPVSGRFSPEQRATYDLVWQAQRAAMAAVVPGNDFLEPNRRAMRVLTEGLIDLRILNATLDEALDPANAFYRRYTLHNVSHMLGIDVHDCARARAQEYRYGTLREGMVLTVEPGLYFQPDDATVPERFRGIGVRIEDDVVVTAQGAENLSAMLPSQADDVEGWIAELWS